MFSIKDPRETVTLTFDFSSAGELATSPSVSVRVVKGIDLSPSAILDGNPQVSGANVMQRVKGGKHGCLYEFEVFATVNGDRLLQEDVLPVQNCVPE